VPGEVWVDQDTRSGNALKGTTFSVDLFINALKGTTFSVDLFINVG
jgi:hypothetical protein